MSDGAVRRHVLDPMWADWEGLPFTDTGLPSAVHGKANSGEERIPAICRIIILNQEAD